MTPNWLEEYAIQDDDFRRNGGELWRDFKASCQLIVESYNRIYSGPENPYFAFNGCSAVSENCFRVRSLKLTDRFVEVWFRPEIKEIEVSPFSSTVNGHLVQVEVKFTVFSSPSGLQLKRNREPVELGLATKLIFEPFMFPNNGIRPEPLNPPAGTYQAPAVRS